ncbi:MAG: hypothetical protein R2739_07145 [Chitinophagales bacterium]
MKKLISIVVFTFTIFYTFAQYPKEFPTDQTGFGKTYAELIKKYCSRDDCKAVAEQLPNAINSGKAASYFFKIKGIAQSMLLKKAGAYPTFFQFGQLLLSLDKTNINTDAIDKNFDILQSLIDDANPGNIKEFTNYIEYLNNLYIYNTLYYTNTNIWKASGSFSVDLINKKPVYTFNSTDLTGISNVDTLTLENESGQYYPLENLWIGEKGKIALKRAGFNPANNFVTFGNHQINFSKSDIEIDSANFTFKPVLDEVLKGKYIDKLLQAKSQGTYYPKFRSYNTNVHFNTLSKEVTLKAGFELEGTNVYGVGSDTVLPTITLKGKDNKEKVRVTANRIQLKEFKDIDIEDASLTIFLDSNKIIHPFVNFSYKADKKAIKAYRDNKPLSKQPFTSEYHKMFIYADILEWNLDSLNMRFSMITYSGDKPAIFESFNYYQPNLENKYKGTNERGPIDKIYSYYESSGDRFIDAQSIAGEINPNVPFKSTEYIFYKLVEDAYINYYPETRTIEVKEKLINHALSAKGKQDYDFIKFASFNRNLNARLNVKTNILEIYGVEEINMSTKSGVKFIPINDTVRIAKNRVMTLSGKIQVGNFDFIAKRVDFDYDNYAFKMKNIDSMVIYVPESDKPNEQGVIRMIRSKTPIQNISGILHIAEPDNKSGTNNNQKYPFFSSGDTSTIAYDKGDNGKKYAKDKFYYQVFPFELDSLNQLNTSNLELNGQLISGGIFAPIKSDLKLQNDKSFGVNVNTGSEGYNLFGNKGKYTADLKLDNNGLSGKGVFEFGPVKLYADTTFFFTDSVYAQLDSVRITEDTKANLPQAMINQSSFIWNVNKDSLTISENKGEVFSMYNSTTNFDGKLILHQNKLSGLGTLSWNHTKITSDNIDFKARAFIAKNGQLNLSTDEGISLLSSNDVNATFDLTNKIADIELNKNDTIPLESFKYVANPKFLHFDLAKNKLTLNAASKSAKFFLLSTDPIKDSLKFITSTADLDLNDNSIHFDGINELLLADSKIIPDKGEIFIEQDGTVRTLKNATVIFNAEKAYHKIKNAEINVIGRNDFNGSGVYDFVLNDGTSENVHIAMIHVKNPDKENGILEKKSKRDKNETDNKAAFYTVANTDILEEDNFRLDKKVYYKGHFDFDSKSKDIYLDGAIKIDIENNASDWLPNKQTLNPENPKIKLDSILNNADNNLVVGLLLDKSIPDFYTSILQTKHGFNDATIMNVKGKMAYSKTEPNTVIFGDENAMTSPYSHSSCLKYNEKTRVVDAAGEINFGLNLAPCKATSVGSFTYTPNTNNLVITSDLAVKFLLQPYVANSIINEFLVGEGAANFVTYRRDKTFFKTVSILAKDTVESNHLIANLYASDSMFIPKSMDYNMLLSGSKFYWDNQDATFKSVETVSLAFFGSTIIKRSYDAYIELGYAYGSDFINIYLQGSSGNWLFIKIKSGQMGIASSVPDVQNTILLLKDSERLYREGKQIIFELMPADLSMRDNFVLRMEDFKARYKVGKDINKPITTPTESEPVTPE